MVGVLGLSRFRGRGRLGGAGKGGLIEVRKAVEGRWVDLADDDGTDPAQRRDVVAVV